MGNCGTYAGFALAAAALSSMDPKETNSSPHTAIARVRTLKQKDHHNSQQLGSHFKQFITCTEKKPVSSMLADGWAKNL